MPGNKQHIIAQLQKELLQLQGFKSVKDGYASAIGLPLIEKAFPNETFQFCAVHEFITSTMENASATAGFITALLSPLLQSGGVMVWIAPVPFIFPPSLQQFGIEPHRVIFIHPRHTKDIGWVMEEALQCEALSAVVAEWSHISFTESRRLQLAVEKSKVTGFLIRRSPRELNTTACVSRWKISSLSSESIDGLPGIGYPRWEVELLKVRNGKPGKWILEWAGDQWKLQESSGALVRELTRKTG
ncbi:MAG: Error-prone repair protein ImuA [Agriterribacter sp.]